MDSSSHLLIVDLATVLGVAALTTLLFRRLRQPAVLGYLLAGLIVGPHVPVPLAAHLQNVQTLAELGVILLMFSVGLEFDFRKLAREGVPAVLLGVAQVGLTTWLGYLAGRGLGWGPRESALMAAALAVSSTMIIAKLFEEHGGKGPFRDLVFSVLVVQDLFAILLLAGMDTSSAASGGIGWALARVGLFLAGLLGLGGLLLPPLLRWAADHGRDETLLVAAVGACFTCAVLASKSGCSPALGAFAAGMLAAGSRRVRPIERLVIPVRDLFGAIFFVAVGMLMDPRVLAGQAGPILLLSAVVLLGSAAGGALGAAAAGIPAPTGLRVGLTLAQPGELSFVLVGVGAAAGLRFPQALPVVVGVAFVTAVAGPFFFRRGEAIARGFDRALPAPAHRALARIQGWTTGLRRRAPRGPRGLPVGYLLLDAVLFNLLAIGASQVRHHPLVRAQPLAAGGLLMLGLAFLGWALHRRTAQLAATAGLRTALLLALAAPSFAVVQPLLPRGPALALAVGILVCVGILGRIPARPAPRFGIQWLLDGVRQPWRQGPAETEASLATLPLAVGSPFVGRPLADLQLALEDAENTGILAVQRGGQWFPAQAGFRLQAGDRIALGATHGALGRAEGLLKG
ncbi:cation:proton antiporter [Mesoterricola silvestris]|uniref:RCK C-terminal domain-containing protein n=1 Tax=Mesoterricola silvestris TaxID=2927979 RepID=A0AA48H1Q8_9BACT|nr:cation:proton antiporter [Mesoterricola silvestris]BDU74413.1 hypothetical protein METEAL_35870 [Mesoterricola silvestris]